MTERSDIILLLLFGAAIGALAFNYLVALPRIETLEESHENRVARLEDDIEEARGGQFEICKTGVDAALDSGHYIDTPGTAWFWNWWTAECGWIDRRGP